MNFWTTNSVLLTVSTLQNTHGTFFYKEGPVGESPCDFFARPRSHNPFSSSVSFWRVDTIYFFKLKKISLQMFSWHVCLYTYAYLISMEIRREYQISWSSWRLWVPCRCQNQRWEQSVLLIAKPTLQPQILFLLERRTMVACDVWWNVL